MSKLELLSDEFISTQDQPATNESEAKKRVSFSQSKLTQDQEIANELGAVGGYSNDLTLADLATNKEVLTQTGNGHLDDNYGKKPKSYIDNVRKLPLTNDGKTLSTKPGDVELMLNCNDLYIYA